MATLTLNDVAEKMKGIDVAILSTHSENGEIATRPMSNNGDVQYDGDSYFFTTEDALCVSDISRNAKVALAYSTEPGLLTGGLYISVEGDAELIRDKAAFKAHWVPDLDNWFDDGVDTPGLVLIKVHARRIKCWDGGEETEVKL